MIQRLPESLRGIHHAPSELYIIAPLAVAIGPYYHHWSDLHLHEAKRAALEEFCRVARQPREAVEDKIISVAASALRCYADCDNIIRRLGDAVVRSKKDTNVVEGFHRRDIEDGIDDSRNVDGVHRRDVEAGINNNKNTNVDDIHGRYIEAGTEDAGNSKGNIKFAEMMLLDGCFLLQLMVSMCPIDPATPPDTDPLMSRAEVHTRIDAILRDVMLLENQIPWCVLEALMELRPAVPVKKFLALMASAFDIGNDKVADISAVLEKQPKYDHDGHPPPHLLGYFHRQQVGAARTQSLRVPRLSSLSSTAAELAEMGVKLTASETKKFGDMSMEKRQRRRCLGLGFFGELSLAPVVLDDRAACWLINMAAYEACVGATQADNFAVSSYISVVALLMNREEDVQELRGKGIINSAMSDKGTLVFFKWAARHLRVGHRYYDVFERLQEYKQERWLWIAIHGFFYKNIKTIVALFSVAGLLAGLFKTILSLKQPYR